MKMKLFWTDTPLVGKGVPSRKDNAIPFENEINAWLTENPRIKVVSVQQSSSIGSLGTSLTLISVWYEDAA